MLKTSGENADIQKLKSRIKELTSVTMVLWKVSVLYSQPPWQLPVECPSPTVIAALWFKGTMQVRSGWLSGLVRRLKFTEAGVPAVGHVERHK